MPPLVKLKSSYIMMVLKNQKLWEVKTLLRDIYKLKITIQRYSIIKTTKAAIQVETICVFRASCQDGLSGEGESVGAHLRTFALAKDEKWHKSFYHQVMQLCEKEEVYYPLWSTNENNSNNL